MKKHAKRRKLSASSSANAAATSSRRLLGEKLSALSTEVAGFSAAAEHATPSAIAKLTLVTRRAEFVQRLYDAVTIFAEELCKILPDRAWIESILAATFDSKVLIYHCYRIESAIKGIDKTLDLPNSETPLEIATDEDLPSRLLRLAQDRAVQQLSQNTATSPAHKRSSGGQAHDVIKGIVGRIKRKYPLDASDHHKLCERLTQIDCLLPKRWRSEKKTWRDCWNDKKFRRNRLGPYLSRIKPAPPGPDSVSPQDGIS